MGPETTRHCCLAIAIGLMLSVPGGQKAVAENIDPADTGEQFAWSENLGWLNAEPGGPGGRGVQVEDDKLSGYMWSENGGWVSLSCTNTNSCASNNFGVSNDGAGNLTGYAWSENYGWISFSCTNSGGCTAGNYAVTIDPATGNFSGLAWSENAGWISFRNQPGATAYGVRTSWPGTQACVPAPDSDLNNDGVVNVLDVSKVGSCFGADPLSVPQCLIADTNCDGTVDSIDMDFVTANFGSPGC